MELGLSAKVKKIRDEVRNFIDDEIRPKERQYFDEVGSTGSRFEFTKTMLSTLDGLKKKARDKNLWNFWLTNSNTGYGLSTVEYAYLAEEMGKCRLAAEVFNCSAPDTGNMEVLERYGTKEHKERWLQPLLEGKIRSAYCMTEPDVASSDATNISLKAKFNGKKYVLNGEKWWISGAGDPRCRLYIVLAKTGTLEMEKHKSHSMFLVPRRRCSNISIIHHPRCLQTQ